MGLSLLYIVGLALTLRMAERLAGPSCVTPNESGYAPRSGARKPDLQGPSMGFGKNRRTSRIGPVALTDSRMYRRKMPHWRVKGSVYFVTFRLADSIPRAILEGWRGERERWLASHGLTADLSSEEKDKRYEAIPEAVRKAFEREEARRLFLELDRGHGACHLRRPEVARVVADALRFHDGSRLVCGDFVVMPNHIHWLLQPCGEEELETLLGSVKRFSSRHINQHLGRNGPLWQRESYDHIVRSSDELTRIRTYIMNNGAKARLREHEYLYYEGYPFDS